MFQKTATLLLQLHSWLH